MDLKFGLNMWVLGNSRVGVTRERSKRWIWKNTSPSFPPGDKVPPQEFSNSHLLGDSVFGLSRGGISSQKNMKCGRNSMIVSQKFENRIATQPSNFTSGYINI